MSSTAFLDASVLYPSTVRSVLMFLAAFGTFRPLWSDDVHREWMAALVRDRPDLDTNRIARTRALMEAHVPGATVTGYQGRIADLVLPDASDRHVLGTFAIYPKQARKPEPSEIKLIESAAHLAGVAIDRHRFREFSASFRPQ